MIERVLLACLLLCCGLSGTPCHAQTAIGQWRDHYSFNHAKQLAPAHGRIYTAYNQCIGYYDITDDAVGRLTKSDGLSDAGIRTIAYDSLTRCLIVAYNNSNIDLITDGKVYNISDLKRSALTGDKEIYSIRCHGRHAYLACGIGIIIIDLDRYEIETTCQLGDDSTTLAVYDLAFMGGRIYAATAQGIRSLPQNDRFPNIGNRWAADSASVLAGIAVRRIAANGNTLMAAGDSPTPRMQYLYHSDGKGNYQLMDSGEVHSLRCAGGYTTAAIDNGIRIYSPTHQRTQIVNTFDWGDLTANDVIRTADGSLWIAHTWAGLLMMGADGSLQWLNPKGNIADEVYSITSFNDKTYICPGGKTSTNVNQGIQGNIYTFNGDTWTSIENNTAQDSLMDFLCLSVNPRNSKQMAAAAWGQGVVEIVDNAIVNVYNEANTDHQIEAYVNGSYRHLRVGGVAYDKRGNLWIVNSLVDKGIVAHYADGTWESFDTRTLFNGAEVYNILCDSVTGYKWITGRENLIYAHDGSTRMAKINPNNGSRLTTSRINCLTQDRSGNLWIGTDKGIKVIYDGRNAFANGGNGETAPVNCVNIVITNGEFAEYLMAYEDVRCIAVDGANRKWVGTASNGIYLLSATGLEELAHFTTANSPLPSNQTTALAVQPLSGEVFVGTSNGTVSYRSTATHANRTPSSNIYAFPNPVRPDYDGPVAIKGFSNNALVHITDISGHVVFSTQALGGQAIWKARTNEGRRVASGVYYVFASDSEGSNRSVAKILVVD